MNIRVEYNTPNLSFHEIFESISAKLVWRYPSIHKVSIVPNPGGHNPNPGGPNGVSTMKIINEGNGKVVVVSFWDRGLDVFAPGIGWDDYNVVQLIGGLGIPPDRLAEIKASGVIHTPFQYPLEHPRTYDDIEKAHKSYIYDLQIKQACFIGCLYHPRDEFMKILSKHPMFKIIGPDAGLRFGPYYEELSKYAMALSFNGAGEYSIRDFESMGMELPLLRSDANTPLHKPFIPNVHYIRASEASNQSWIIYPGTTFKQIADQFVDAVEKAMPNGELLTRIAENNRAYFNHYVKPKDITKLFFQLFDISVLT